jgi:hypothetical protein
MRHETHPNHGHVHGKDCGHTAVRHGDHLDYIHDGHLHHEHEGHVDECTLEVGTRNPSACTPSHACSGHARAHAHGPDCGHESLRHGDHVDYVVAGHLHHPHGDHCDDHGAIDVTRGSAR